MSEALDIDLYQATMLKAYWQNNKHEIRGAMELFNRKLPSCRSFWVAAGVNRVVDYLSKLKFTKEDILLLGTIPALKDNFEGFANYLEKIDFSKELKLYAMNEGEIFFPQEPVLRIEGPIALAQYVEKKILSILNHDVRIASKAVRVVLAANGRDVFEFGGRRAHDASTADSARAAFIGGCTASSSVEAYVKYGIPCVGTMGHVWVLSFDSEKEAFESWNNVYPNSIYLVDTYNPYSGARNAIISTGGTLGGIRLDSGNLAEQALNIKRDLGNGAEYNSKIIASDDLNEYKIKEILSCGAPIDAFGVGTELVSTPDSSSCGFVYKLVSVERGGKEIFVSKKSNGKTTWPGRKQVYRHFMKYTDKTIITHDTIDLADSSGYSDSDSFPLLLPAKIESLSHSEMINRTSKAREYLKTQLNNMCDYLKLISDNNVLNYPVEFSENLKEEKSRL